MAGFQRQGNCQGCYLFQGKARSPPGSGSSEEIKIQFPIVEDETANAYSSPEEKWVPTGERLGPSAADIVIIRPCWGILGVASPPILKWLRNLV